MSEKKEYIGIFKTSDVKINGKGYIAKIPAGGSELYTRAEAVERMARAMAFVSNITFVSKEQWKVVENGLRISAEAALDALINSQDNDHVDDQKRITDGD